MRKSRFACPTIEVDLKAILKRGRRGFWVSLALALAIHLGMTQIKLFEGSRGEAPRPLTTKFIKREPRLVKPLELKKRPKPRPRPMRRKVVRIKAKMSVREAALRATSFLRVLDTMARPRAGVQRTVAFSGIFVEPIIEPGEIRGTKEPKSCVDMSLEMLDIDALDIGKYRAMIIQHPGDRRKIKGYLHLAVLQSNTIVRPG